MAVVNRRFSRTGCFLAAFDIAFIAAFSPFGGISGFFHAKISKIARLRHRAFMVYSNTGHPHSQGKAVLYLLQQIQIDNIT